MIPSHNVRILVATRPVDFRMGHDGLAALGQSVLKEDPCTHCPPGDLHRKSAERGHGLRLPGETGGPAEDPVLG